MNKETCEQLQIQIDDKLGFLITKHLYIQFYWQIRVDYGKIWRQIEDQISDQLDSRIREQITEKLKQELKNEI